MNTHRAKIPPGTDPSLSTDATIAKCLNHIIDQTNIQFSTGRGHPISADNSVDKSVVRLLELCHQTGNADLYARVLNRVLAPEQLRKHRNDLRSVLSPLLTALLTFVNSIGSGPQLPPFRSAITTIISVFVDNVLGPKPDPQSLQALLQRYSKVGCTCQQCSEVVSFITTSPELRKLWYKIGATKARHVAAKFAGLPGVTVEVLTN